LKKRYRAPKPKQDEINIKWGRLPHDVPDLCVTWGKGTQKADANLIMSVLHGERHRPFNDSWSPGLVDELISRDYDITTLKFSIKKNTHNKKN